MGDSPEIWTQRFLVCEFLVGGLAVRLFAEQDLKGVSRSIREHFFVYIACSCFAWQGLKGRIACQMISHHVNNTNNDNDSDNDTTTTTTTNHNNTNDNIIIHT